MSSTTSDNLSPAAVLIPLLSVSAIVLELSPFLWHLKNRNLGASCMIVYFFLLQIMAVVNAITWPRDSSLERYDGVGLCDLEIRIQLMAYIGIPGCIFCIIRRLAAILAPDRAVLSEASKAKRRFLVDLFICVGFPVVINALYYIVQPRRFLVFTVAGCKWPIAYSWPSVLIVQMWPIVFSIFNAYLAVVVLYRLHKYRSGVSTLMSNSSTTKSRFMRLFIISVILIFIVLPISIQSLVIPIQRGYTAFDWHFTHNVDWGVLKIPNGGHVDAVAADAIAAIIGGYLIFICFGLGKDAIIMYRGWAKKLGLLSILPCLQERRRTSSSTTTPFGSALDGSMGGRSITTATTTRQITVTTTNELKSEPNSPMTAGRRPSFWSFHLGKEKPSLDLYNSQV